MSIKYNQFGEVISVNGLTTGQRLGKPMQDAKPKKAEHNEAYAIAKKTVGNIKNVVDDNQPENIGDELEERIEALEAGGCDWNAFEGEEGYIKNRTHYDETTVNSRLDFTAALLSNNYEKYNGAVFYGNDVVIPVYAGNGVTYSRGRWSLPNGYNWYCTIDGKEIKIPQFDKLEFNKQNTLGDTFKGYEVKAKPVTTTIFVDGKQKNYSVCLFVTIVGYGADKPLPHIQLEYRKGEFKKLDPKFLPSGYPYKAKKEYSVVHSWTEENEGYVVLEGFPPFGVGDTVKLKIDGAEYSFVAEEYYDGAAVIHPGDGIEVTCNSSGEVSLFFDADGTITIEWEDTVIVPMTEEFLPEGIGGVLGVTIVYDGSSYSCNKTYNEVLDALNNNIPIFTVYADKSDSDYTRQYYYGEVKYYTNDELIRFDRATASNWETLYLNPDNTISQPAPV